jgi:prephenate dehydrogenase
MTSTGSININESSKELNSSKASPLGGGGGVTVTIVGVGLIGGSFALALKDNGLAKHIIGVTRSEKSAKRAIELGLVDEVLPLEEAVRKSDLIYVAIPVDTTIPTMVQINVLWQRTRCGVRNTVVRKQQCMAHLMVAPV